MAIETNGENALPEKRPLGKVAQALADTGKLLAGAAIGYGVAKGVEVLIPEPRVFGFALELGLSAVGGFIGSIVEVEPS